MVRLKQRYILFEVLSPPTSEQWESYSESLDSSLSHLHRSSPEEINPKRLLQMIRQALKDHYGDYGAGAAGILLVIKYFSQKTSTGILRCARQHVDTVVAAIALINRLGDNEVILRCVHVSGTIKKCEIASIKRDQDDIIRLQRQKRVTAKLS